LWSARLRSTFARSAQLQRQRVHGPGQFVGEERVDQPLAVDAAFARKRGADDRHRKMGFAAVARTRMPGMLGRIVGDLQQRRARAVSSLARMRWATLVMAILRFESRTAAL